jgi:hypothetical protein
MQQQLDLESLAQSEQLLGATGAEPSARFGGIVGSLMQGIMAIGLIIVFFYFIWGAFDWLTSAGEKGKLESARNKMLHAGIGIIILASTTALFMLVQYFVGVSVIDFGGAPTAPNTPTATYRCVASMTSCPAGESAVSPSSCQPACTGASICCSKP